MSRYSRIVVYVLRFSRHARPLPIMHMHSVLSIPRMFMGSNELMEYRALHIRVCYNVRRLNRCFTLSEKIPNRKFQFRKTCELILWLTVQIRSTIQSAVLFIGCSLYFIRHIDRSVFILYYNKNIVHYIYVYMNLCFIDIL